MRSGPVDWNGRQVAARLRPPPFWFHAGDRRQINLPSSILDAIISVGDRVKSAVATRFRIWATQKLREFRV